MKTERDKMMALFVRTQGPDLGRLMMEDFLQTFRIGAEVLDTPVSEKDFAEWLEVIDREGPAMMAELQGRSFPPLPPGFGPQN